MGLPLKNFVKIKALDTHDKVLNFYGLPLKKSIGPQPEWSGGGWGGEGQILNVIAAYHVNITQIFESCWFARDFTVARSLGEQQKHFSLLGTSLQMQLSFLTPTHLCRRDSSALITEMP